ncbi:MAG TPA: TlpA disulfide reductase family protein [Puia sp.]|nr:TlpA disulfide reductase family protein [Puia sp.]
MIHFTSNKMTLTLFSLLFILAGFSLDKAFGQAAGGHSRFSLEGEIVGRDTGRVVLWYKDRDNKDRRDTLPVSKGRFHYSGTVNMVCEAYLWMDISNHIFDDSSVIRFLLEPHSMRVSYKPHGGSDPLITGSRSQTEKEKFDKQKSFLLFAKARVYQSIYSLLDDLKVNANTDIQNQLDRLWKKRDSLSERIKALDIKYIEEHPKSVVSAYLLLRHTHKPFIPVDSLETYYKALSTEVKKSSLGHDVLAYIYPLTDDNDFRKENPLIDGAFDQRLSELHSVYDLSLKDTAGNTIALSAFKTKYVVIDFWASWCGPCIANIPVLEQMMADYKSDSVQFISISLDRDPDDWKGAIKKHHFTGIQLGDLDGFKSLVSMFCKVTYVPKYIIADQNGRIIDYDAPLADGMNLRNMLNALLKQSL